MQAPKGFGRYKNWYAPLGVIIGSGGSNPLEQAKEFAQKWNASQVMLGNVFLLGEEKKAFSDIFTEDNGHWQINTLSKEKGTLYLKLQGLDADSDIINGLISYDNTAKTITITDGNSFTMPAEDVSLLAITWDIYNIRIAVCGEVNYIIQDDVFENLTVAINSNVVSKLQAYAYIPRKLEITELRGLTETKHIAIDNGDIYLKPNGVTIAAYPETVVGWYKFDARDGFGEVDVLVIDTFANLSSIIREYPDDLGDGSNNMNEFVNITWGGVTKSIALNHVVTSKLTSFSSDNDTLGFRFTNINQNILSWDVSNNTSLYSFARYSALSSDLSEWNVSVCTIFSYVMLDNVNINTNVKKWNVSNAISLIGAFTRAHKMVLEVENWKVSRCSLFNSAFAQLSTFNADIGRWDMSSATGMVGMLQDTGFAQDISSWCVENIQTEPANFATNSPLASLPDFQPKWGEPCITCSDGSKHHEDYICGV